MVLGRLVIFGVTLVGVVAFVAWQAYRRNQLRAYRHHNYKHGRAVYFQPQSDGTLTQEECAICLEEMTIVHRTSTLPCSHTFHADCIGMWSRYDRSCPLCRLSFLHID